MTAEETMMLKIWRDTTSDNLELSDSIVTSTSLLANDVLRDMKRKRVHRPGVQTLRVNLLTER